MPTSIYVIAADPAGPVKIGHSKNPEARLKQLQTGHAGRLKLHFQQEIADKEVRLMERAIHDTIGYKRVTGEWFDISVESAIAEVRHAVIVHTDNLLPKSPSEVLAEFGLSRD